MNIQFPLDLDYPQPKFFFGQILEDKKQDRGVVVGMQVASAEWEYMLLYIDLEVLGNYVKENELATATLIEGDII